MLRPSYSQSPKCFRRKSILGRWRHTFAAGDAFTQDAILEAERDPVLPTIISEDGTHALRKRGGGNRPLPLPPHMDPVRRAQRNKWKDPKKSPPKLEEMTDFQKKLEKNVYAQALATPVRACNITRARLPLSFLLPISAVPQPNTKEHALLPIDLFCETQPGDKELRDSIQPAGMRVYTTLRQSFLNYLGQTRKWKMIPDRRTSTKIRKSHQKDLSWRNDMPEFVLGMLREAIWKKLKELIEEQKKGSLVSCPGDVEQLDALENTACVLLMRSIQSPERQQIEREEEAVNDQVDQAVRTFYTIAEELGMLRRPAGGIYSPVVPRLHPTIRKPPLDFPTIRLKGSEVPVYSLPDLLTEDQMRTLLNHTRYETATCIVVEQLPSTLLLQTQLLQMQYFLAEA